MGRASRRTRERREAAGREPFTRLDLGTALNVVCAATLSPSASHRLPTLTSAYLALLRRSRNGKVRATHEHLDELLAGGLDAAATRGVPLASVEDFVPLEIRDEVTSRFRGELHRLVPGGWEAPVSVVEDAALAARAFDRFLVPQAGFGIADLTELVLRYGDQLIGVLRETWPRDVITEVRGDASISAAEADARAECAGLEDVAGSCQYPDRALLALDWATRELNEAEDRFDQCGSSLGPVLALRSKRGRVAVPGGLLLDVVHEAVAVLRAEALANDEAGGHWQHVARNYVLDRVAALGPVALDMDAGDGPITALQLVDDHLFLAIDVVPFGLGDGSLSDAKKRLAAFSPGALVSSESGDQGIPLAAEVARAVVVVGMGNLIDFTAVDEAHVPLLEAQVLRWMIGTGERPDDLPRFLLDSAEEPGPHLSFGPFDEWEVWRSGDVGVHDVGITPTFTAVEPHGEAAEWERHRDLADLERALLNAGLPPLVRWPQVRGELDAPDSALLEDFARRLRVRITRLSDGLIIAVADPGVSSGRVPADRVARATLWRLRHMGSIPGLLALDAACLRVTVSYSSEPIVGGATAERVDGAIDLTYNDPDPEQSDPATQLEVAVGQALSRLVPVDSRADFLSAWEAAPAGLAIDVTFIPQTVADPGPFHPPHPAIISQERRWLAQQLANADVTPGRRTGSDASQLEAHIYSLLDERYSSLLHGVDSEAAIRIAFEDLERLHAERSGHDGEVSRRLRLHYSADTDIDLQTVLEERDELVRRIRSVAHVAETLVRDRSAGETPLAGRVKWRIYALAELMVESGLRRDALDYGLANTAIEVTDAFEVRLHAGTSDFDNATFMQARTAASLPRSTSASLGRDDDASEALPATSRDDLEAAFVQTCGFSPDHLGAVLDCIIGWAEVSEDRPVSEASAIAVATAAHDLSNLDSEAIAAALEQLTLRSEDLAGPIEHWKVDQRRHRLATRPIVRRPSGELLICPHTATYAREIINGHLSDLRSPWADAIPDSLATALARLREARNIEFERQLQSKLRQVPAFITRPNVKKDTQLGDWLTEREIDALCVDPGRRRLWIIEAKDPAPDFVARQIGRSIKRFYEDYIPKLKGSIDRARASLPSVINELGYHEDDTSGWTVHGAVVTRRVEPAAFRGTPAVWFMTLHTALQTLDCDQLPETRYGVLRTDAVSN